MRFSLACAAMALLAVSSSAYGRITGMTVQQNGPLKQGDKFNVTFACEDYITNNNQYYVVFGLHEGQVYQGTIGAQEFAHYDIYEKARKASDEGPNGHFTLTLTTPAYSGSLHHANLTAAVFNTVGASGGVGIDFYRDVVRVVKASS